MKNTKIVLVAEWDGWCGACGADRPLVLTRTGRQSLRTWLTGAADDSRPLVLTCRLCGTGVDVPLEQDDPPVIVAEVGERPGAQDPQDAAAPSVAGPVPSDVPVDVPLDVPVHEAAPAAVTVPSSASAVELAAGRQVVAQALGALLAQRTAPTSHPAAPEVPAVAPLVPLQRTAHGGLTELQLLADGIDLLSTGRS